MREDQDPTRPSHECLTVNLSKKCKGRREVGDIGRYDVISIYFVPARHKAGDDLSIWVIAANMSFAFHLLPNAPLREISQSLLRLNDCTWQKRPILQR
jgi:hypothetical protein